MNATAAKLQKFAERGIAAQKAADAAIADARKEEFAMIATAAIVPSPLNPRKQIAEEQLEELAESIRREGILQPLLLRAKQPLLNADSSVYEIVTGERRWRAARLAALETIPAMVREMDDAAVLDAQIIENGQREDVTPLEEAAAYRLRLKIAGESGVKMTVKDLAARVSKSWRTVYDRLELLNLSDAAKKALDAGKISTAHAAELTRLEVELQKKALKAMHEAATGWDGPMTVRDLRDWITSEKRRIEWFEEEAKGKHSRVENVTTRYQRPASELAKERRARAIAQARNEALRQIVAKVRAWDVRAAAVTLADRTRFEGQKVCCRILGLVDEKKRPAYFDYRKALRNHIEHADAAGVQRAIAALSLVPEDGFTQSGYGTWGGKENLAQLYAAGKKVGVDVPKLERELAAEKSKRLRTSAKSKSARRAA